MAASVERSVRSLLLSLLVVATIVSGCAAPVMHGDPSSPDTAHPHSIYVVRQSWHTGIVVHAADVPANAWLARRDFPDAAYLEVGWGDRDGGSSLQRGGMGPLTLAVPPQRHAGLDAPPTLLIS